MADSSKILNVIDQLGSGQAMLKAAFMAVHGANGLDSEETDAMASLLELAEERFDAVKASLEKLRGEDAGKAAGD